MLTYPSTHGVFEETVREICRIVHDNGGQVYMDGANMNAHGRPLPPRRYRRRCLPSESAQNILHSARRRRSRHGPDRRRVALAPFLPGQGTAGHRPDLRGALRQRRHPGHFVCLHRPDGRRRPEARHAKWPSSMPTTWPSALKRIIPIVFKGTNGRCAHEFIIDCKSFEATSGVKVEDIAKRLMDYGFHAPTMSWPEPGTLMIEPTESESKAELDRFCDAMIAIRQEIREIEAGQRAPGRQPAEERPAHRGSDRIRRLATSLFARKSRVPRAMDAAFQILARRRPHRQSLRRPQPRLRLSADERIWPMIPPSAADGAV